jgi:hypothetical protein
MAQISVYLPDGLKARLAQASRASGESAAEIIRSALEHWLTRLPLGPRSSMIGVIQFDDPDLAGQVDEVLAEGFGQA